MKQKKKIGDITIRDLQNMCPQLKNPNYQNLPDFCDYCGHREICFSRVFELIRIKNLDDEIEVDCNE